MNQNPNAVAVVGSRDYPALDAVHRYVTEIPECSEVISGGAAGVDQAAIDAAKAAGLRTRIFEADWETHGRKAGPIRNALIVDASHRVLAFWNQRSRGTLNTIVLAAEKGHPVEVFGEDGKPLALEIALDAAGPLNVYAGIQRARGIVVEADERKDSHFWDPPIKHLAESRAVGDASSDEGPVRGWYLMEAQGGGKRKTVGPFPSRHAALIASRMHHVSAAFMRHQRLSFPTTA